MEHKTDILKQVADLRNAGEAFVLATVVRTVAATAAKAGAKPTRASVLAAMGKLDVDLKGLRGGPIQWTASNHFRARQSYRVYRFDPAKGAIERVQDWTAFDVK